MAPRVSLLALTCTALIAAEQGYVNPQQCRPCHQAIFDSYAQTGMGRSMAVVTQQPPKLAEFFHEPSQRSYSVVERSGKPFLRRQQAGGQNIIEKSIDLALGSGNHSVTFLHRNGRGRLLELPVSWYSEQGGHWAMSPGYDRPDHSDFRREVSPSCLFCHSAYPSDAKGEGTGAIDCQRCHGPGEAHVGRRGSIVNPAKLTTARRVEVCLQCHLESASRTLPDAIRHFDRGPFSFRPGEPLSNFMLYFQFTDLASDERITVNGAGYGMLRSKCYLRSEGRMTCTTCHDPHRKQAEVHFTEVCRSCHTSVHTRETAACTGCHMPKRRTEDAVHVVMTDHLIRRKPLSEDPVAPLAENHSRHAGPVKLLYPPQLPASAENNLYLSLARVRSGNATSAEIAELERAITAAKPKSPEPWIGLGDALRKRSQDGAALRAYRNAISLDNTNPAALVAASELGPPEESVPVLRAALTRARESTELRNALAVVYGRLGQFDAALRVLSEAVQIDPDDPVSWLNTGVALEAKGDRNGAEAAYRQALLLQPDLRRAQEYLRRVAQR